MKKNHREKFFASTGEPIGLENDPFKVDHAEPGKDVRWIGVKLQIENIQDVKPVEPTPEQIELIRAGKLDQLPAGAYFWNEPIVVQTF